MKKTNKTLLPGSFIILALAAILLLAGCRGNSVQVGDLSSDIPLPSDEVKNLIVKAPSDIYNLSRGWNIIVSPLAVPNKFSEINISYNKNTKNLKNAAIAG